MKSVFFIPLEKYAVVSHWVKYIAFAKPVRENFSNGSKTGFNTPSEHFLTGFISRNGCFLPIIILFNLFFGWMFLPAHTWLFIEGILIILFFINSYIFLRRLSSIPLRRATKGDEVIDVEGEIVEEKQKLK